MNELNNTLTDLKNKIETLVKLHKELKSENNKLKTEITDLKQKLVSAVSEKKELQQNNQELIQKSTSEKSNIVTETKVKINELVQEIDNCIALLK